MLDLISGSAQGHGPVHLLLISAADVGFAWGGVPCSLPPFRMMTGSVQHFYSSILDAWRYRVFAKLAEREGFSGAQFVDYKGSLQPLELFPPEGERYNVVKNHFKWGFGTDSFLARPRRKMFHVDFAVARMVMAFVLGVYLFPNLHVRKL